MMGLLNAHDTLVTQLLMRHEFGYRNGRDQDPPEALVYCRKEERPQMPHSVPRSKCSFLTIPYRQDLPPHNSTPDWQPLKTKRIPHYLNTQYVPRSKHFYLVYKNQPVYAVSGTSRCLFSDKYKLTL